MRLIFLENISKEIYLVETAYEEYESVNQYSFSAKVVNTIECLNVTNREKESFYGVTPEEDDDIFKSYKKRHSLRVFS